MAQTLGVSDLLGLFIGLYLIAGGVALIREPDLYRQILVTLRENGAIGFLVGLIAFVIGAAIVALHNAWDSVMAIFVSFVGWAALAEGMALIAVRREFLDLAGRLRLKGALLRGISIAGIVIGVLLVIVALR